MSGKHNKKGGRYFDLKERKKIDRKAKRRKLAAAREGAKD